MYASDAPKMKCCVSVRPHTLTLTTLILVRWIWVYLHDLELAALMLIQLESNDSINMTTTAIISTTANTPESTYP